MTADGGHGAAVLRHGAGGALQHRELLPPYLPGLLRHPPTHAVCDAMPRADIALCAPRWRTCVTSRPVLPPPCDPQIRCAMPSIDTCCAAPRRLCPRYGRHAHLQVCPCERGLLCDARH
eukprot:1754106-Rhodomonas_salina.1